MGKILYIRLDSSPLPEASEDIIVKDFNLESYFCTLFGKRLLEDAGLAGTILYPGKLITDFEKVDEESYKEIIRQWEEVLSYLLIYQSEDDTDFIFKLPDSYIDWLSTCNISLSSLRKNYHTHVSSVSIKRARLFSIVHKTLKNKLIHFLRKSKDWINVIVFSIEGINKECYIVHLWKHILDCEIITQKEFRYKVWNKNNFLIHNVVLGETPFSKIKKMHASQDDIGVIYWDDAPYIMFSKEWFADSNQSDTIDLYGIKRNKDFPATWKELGFDWRMSYLDWLDLLYKLKFDVIAGRDPCVLNGHFGRYFYAEVIARTADHKLLFTFGFGNESGGETEESQDTLDYIIVRTYSKEAYDSFPIFPYSL